MYGQNWRLSSSASVDHWKICWACFRAIIIEVSHLAARKAWSRMKAIHWNLLIMSPHCDTEHNRPCMFQLVASIVFGEVCTIAVSKSHERGTQEQTEKQKGLVSKYMCKHYVCFDLGVLNGVGDSSFQVFKLRYCGPSNLVKCWRVLVALQLCPLFRVGVGAMVTCEKLQRWWREGIPFYTPNMPHTLVWTARRVDTEGNMIHCSEGIRHIRKTLSFCLPKHDAAGADRAPSGIKEISTTLRYRPRWRLTAFLLGLSASGRNYIFVHVHGVCSGSTFQMKHVEESAAEHFCAMLSPTMMF